MIYRNGMAVGVGYGEGGTVVVTCCLSTWKNIPPIRVAINRLFEKLLMDKQFIVVLSISNNNYSIFDLKKKIIGGAF